MGPIVRLALICLLTNINALWYLNTIRRSVAMTLIADIVSRPIRADLERM